MVNVKSKAQRNARRRAVRLPGLARLAFGKRSADASSFLVSGLFHAMLLLILALYALPLVVGRTSVLLMRGIRFTQVLVCASLA
jgi:hypothetical protein